VGFTAIDICAGLVAVVLPAAGLAESHPAPSLVVDDTEKGTGSVEPVSSATFCEGGALVACVRKITPPGVGFGLVRTAVGVTFNTT
jgi:hypothetical protein